MRQHPDDFHDEDLDPFDGDNDDLEELGTPVYQGSSLSVRALTAQELQRFLDAHRDQPAELLGSGWATLNPSGQPLGGSWTPPAATSPAPSGPPSGSLGSPGRSALAVYRRRRSEELVAWTRSLAWRTPLVAAAALTGPWRRSAGKPRRSAACWAPTPPPLVCVHGAQVHGGGLHAQGVAIIPASLLRGALGCDRVLSDAKVELLATTAWTRLHPAA